MLGNQSLEAEFASLAEQVWPDLALFEGRREYAIRSARQQSFKVHLSHGQWLGVVAIEGEDIEGIELDFIVVLAGMQRVEIRNAIDPRFSVDHKLTGAVFQGGFTYRGKRLVQS